MDPALGHRGAVVEQRGGAGAPLIGVHRAGPLDGHPERGAHVGVQSGQCRLEVGGRDADSGRTPSNFSP